HQVPHENVHDIIIYTKGFGARHGSKLRYTFNRTRIFRILTRFDSTRSQPGVNIFSAMIKSIKLITIPVLDQNRALDLYPQKLGFTIIPDQPVNGKQRWIELRIPKAETRVTLFTPEGHEGRVGSFTGVSYDCDDVERTYRDLSAKGVPFDAPPKKEP